TDQLLKNHFPDSFLLYMPRDIVSGDFYWLSRKKERIYFALADCTGHGVPGAFLSILGITFLNQVVDRNENQLASAVLNSLREHVMKALHQTGEISEQKDGIDMSLCIVDTSTNLLQFAGAFNPMYIVKNNTQLIEIPADKMPIGVSAEEETSFKNHEVELCEGDMIYMFTDGYADQFGGSKGKKFKFRPFRNLLIQVSKLPVGEQKNELRLKHLEWRGKNIQLDDISVFGFRHHLPG
ncbi:MAG: serine/threonine-protein phosphatase, partial [Bacteroidales bacterium]|nr:serine/threonine-protein phosphatase [Bacteroidales bacterium]